jgi:hypothetical protein
MTNVYQYICGSQQLTDPGCWAQYNYCFSCGDTSNTNTTGEVVSNFTGSPNATMDDIVQLYPDAANFFLDNTTLYVDIIPKASEVPTS